MTVPPDLSRLCPEDASPFPLADDFPLMFHVVDTDGFIVRVSDLWLQGLQYTRDAVIGQKSFEFLTGDSAASARMLFPRHRARGGLTNIRQTFRRSDGSDVVCAMSSAVLRSRGGEEVGSVVVLNSLDDDHALIDGLNSKAFRLEACLDGMNAGTWEWNIQTGQTVFNDRWAEIVGYSLEELQPVSIETWLSLAHPDDLPASEAALTAHWEGRAEFYDFEARMRHKNGQWVWVHDRGRVFTRTSDGKPEWMFGTHFCIDQRKTETAEAERLSRMFDRTSAVAGVGGWEVDLDTQEVIWCRETRRIHGVPDGFKPSLKDGINFYAPEARETITRAVEEGMTHGVPWDLELPFIRLSGEPIVVRAVGDVEFENGVPRRIFGAFQDITERVEQHRKLNETVAALEESNADLDQFAYIASHDLKAPLRVISNATTWLEEDLEGLLTDQTRTSLALLKNRVKRMDRLLSDLLEHSRIGRTEIDSSPMPLACLLEDVIGLVHLPDGFRIDAGKHLDTVSLPRMPATKILLNLVSNAVKHHDLDTGTIRVDAVPGDQTVAIKVTDDGPGIPENMQKQAFELFRTLRPRDQVEGSGMGLAIVEKSALRAGGSVHLFSEGRGCEFTVTLPIAAPPIAEGEASK